MFSGGDSSGEGVNLSRFSHFQLPPTQSVPVPACGLNNTSSTSAASIDWASLAQQWIQMRDFSGADISSTMPEAPPPPNISGGPLSGKSSIHSNVVESQLQRNDYPSYSKKPRFDEQGEADMEMDDEEDSARAAIATVQLMQPTILPPTLIQPNWFVQPAVTTVLPCNDTDSNLLQQQQQKPAQWDVWPPRVLPATSATVQCEPTNPTAHIPSLMKISIPDPNMCPIKPIPDNHNESNPVVTMDAAKRKILPAWIREGLEKMEREKQKQFERQQQTLRDVTDDKFSSGDSTHVPHQADVETVNNKNITILESDSSVNEEDDNERAVAIAAATCIAKSCDMTLFSNDAEYASTQQIDELNCGKSYEQKLSDLMIVVRKTLTELLLEVTNEEISDISHEVIKSYKAKASTAPVIPKSAISTITGRLGLAAYEDSCSDDSLSETDESVKEDNLSDSEEEIKATIRAKRKAFSKMSEEIEERIAECALREEQKLKYYTQQEQHDKDPQTLQKQLESTGSQLELERGTSSYNTCNYRPTGSAMGRTSGKVYEKEFGETSDSKLQLSNGKRHKERTTRFSDNKDSKGTTIVAASDYISQFQSNQIETAAQKINSVVLQMHVDGSMKAVSDISTKSIDQAPNTVMSLIEKSLAKAKKGKSYSKKKRRTVSHTSDNNGSSSDDSNSLATSNSSQNSSKNSRSSSSKHKSKHRVHHMSSSSFTRKSNRVRSSDRYPRHIDDHKSSRHRYHSSDSEEFSEDKYSNSNKKYRSSHYRDHHERKTRRSKSKSRSRSRSNYSSSRRRH